MDTDGNNNAGEKSGTYRVKKISVRRGWAIDQIKFEYDDNKTWAVGVDNGREDQRKFIMTPGEYVVRVTHETLTQRWYAGASVEFETNKGRVMKFNPYLKTGLKDQQVTKKAENGMEIIMLNIKHGKLIDVHQQAVPRMEVCLAPKEWFIFVDSGEEIKEFLKKKEAVSFAKNKMGILIDVKNNKLVHQTVYRDSFQKCKTLAIEKGYFFQNTEEEGGYKDVINIFKNHFSVRSDLPLFLTTLFLLTSSSYLSTYTDVISGYALTSFGQNNQGETHNLTLPKILCSFYDCKEIGIANPLVLSLLIAQLLSSLFHAGNIFFHSILKESRLATMRKSMLKHVLGMEMSYFDEKTAEDIRYAMDPVVILDIITWKVPYFISTICKAIFIPYYMVFLNWKLTVLSLTLLAFLQLIQIPILKKYQLLYKLEDKINLLARQSERESISMISSVKHFSKESLHLGEQAKALDQVQQLNYQKNFFRFLTSFIFGSFNSIALCASLLYMNYKGETEDLTAGSVTSFFILFQQIFSIWDGLQAWYQDILYNLPLAERISTLMNKKSNLKTGPLQPDNLSGKIEFRNVSFTYPSRPGEEVIKNLSVTLSPGKVTAVVGDSGAGKSTLTNLLMRLYDPTSGNIFVDGFNLKELNLEAYHNFISVVNQNPLLFKTSIGENIAYGATSDSISDEEIVASAKLANAYDFIMGFRGGMDTSAGSLGSQLSGGQKQRLAIARAVVRNPNILILDEATSSLDAENEKIVSEALERVKDGRTTVVIAHRLSTIRNADEILVMKKGTLVERGTHEELLKLDGVYRKLISKQIEENALK